MSRINHSLIILLLSIASLLTLGGCEKIIDLELDNIEPKIVIEGSITDALEPQIVKITKTYDFTEPNKFNGVSGAKVVVTSSTGQRLAFTEIFPGVYQSPNFRGRSGRTYSIEVTSEGKTYSASSTMPSKVTLDSLTYKQLSVFGETDTYIAVNYDDPPGIENYYRYILRAKNKIEEDGVSEDRFNDGNKVSNILFYELEDLDSGDSVDVDFQCIDRNVFKYFFSIAQISGEGGPPVSPSNPVSNFNNGALGIFSAHTVSRKSIVLK